MAHPIEPKRNPDRVRPAYWCVQFFVRFIFRVCFGLRLEGRRNVPRTGPFILASNHQSWFDPPIVGASCPREIFFAAKQELFKPPVLRHIVKFLNSIPIKRSGFDRDALVKLGQTLENGFGIIIFPEGTRFLDGKLHPPKLGVGMLASKYHVPIIPVHVTGSCNLRNQLIGRKLRVQFGKPIEPSEFPIEEGSKRKDRYIGISNLVMQRIAQIGGVDPPEAV